MSSNGVQLTEQYHWPPEFQEIRRNKESQSGHAGERKLSLMR